MLRQLEALRLVVGADALVLEVPVQAAASVGTGNLPQRALDAATELMIGLFRAGFQKL